MIVLGLQVRPPVVEKEAGHGQGRGQYQPAEAAASAASSRRHQ
jgi:hypothetical protein